MFEFKTVNDNTDSVFFGGILLGRLYHRAVAKNQKPEFTIVDFDVLDVIPGSALEEKLKEPSKDRETLAKLMKKHRLFKSVA